IDLHHSSDGASRIWEQRDVLGQATGSDPLAATGERLRKLARKAVDLRTTIVPARRPHELFVKFARAAACFRYAQGDIL
ncbi:hypothetical protein, partial [Salmonella enterica]|uniref:hypothetical protein n=1 Tax=Salmonella enterica TaxID=28901 RepID=UPI001E454E9E